MNLDKEKITASTWNKVAALYQEKFMDLELYNDTYDSFCDLLKENTSVLEVGCGPGNITRYLLTKRSDFKILGTDFAPNMLELARKNNPGADFRELDVRSLSSIELLFDGVIAGFIIPYLSAEECDQFIKNANHLLHENGILYLSFTEGNYADSGFLSASTGDQTYFYYHSQEKIEAQLKLNHFSVSSRTNKVFSRPSGSEELHVILIATKKG